MEYDTYQGKGNKEADKIFPVFAGQEGKHDSNQVIGSPCQGNGNDNHQQIKEMLDRPFFQPAEKTEDKDYNRYNTNYYHVTVSLKYLFPVELKSRRQRCESQRVQIPLP